MKPIAPKHKQATAGKVAKIPTGPAIATPSNTTPKAEPMSAKTRQAAYRSRREQAGFTRLGFWLHLDDFFAGRAAGLKDQPGARTAHIPADADQVSWAFGFFDGRCAHGSKTHQGPFLPLLPKQHQPRPATPEDYH